MYHSNTAGTNPTSARTITFECDECGTVSTGVASVSVTSHKVANKIAAAHRAGHAAEAVRAAAIADDPFDGLA